jgi:hypothetical protein
MARNAAWCAPLRDLVDEPLTVVRATLACP